MRHQIGYSEETEEGKKERSLINHAQIHSFALLDNLGKHLNVYNCLNMRVERTRTHQGSGEYLYSGIQKGRTINPMIC